VGNCIGDGTVISAAALRVIPSRRELVVDELAASVHGTRHPEELPAPAQGSPM
jgi:hypothetical protein